MTTYYPSASALDWHCSLDTTNPFVVLFVSCCCEYWKQTSVALRRFNNARLNNLMHPSQSRDGHGMMSRVQYPVSSKLRLGKINNIVVDSLAFYMFIAFEVLWWRVLLNENVIMYSTVMYEIRFLIPVKRASTLSRIRLKPFDK